MWFWLRVSYEIPHILLAWTIVIWSFVQSQRIYFQALLRLMGGNLKFLAMWDSPSGWSEHGIWRASEWEETPYCLLWPSLWITHFTSPYVHYRQIISQSVLDWGRQGSPGATFQASYHSLPWGPNDSHASHMQNRVTKALKSSHYSISSKSRIFSSKSDASEDKAPSVNWRSYFSALYIPRW